jgi:integrase
VSSFIRQRGATWTAYWHEVDSATGERVQRSKGGHRIKKDAQEHLNEVMGKVQNGTYKRDSKMTVRELLVDHWLPTKKTEGLSAATIQHYEETVEHWILREDIGLGGIRAQALTPKQVTDWRDALAKTTTSGGRAGLSQRTISASVGALKSAYKWAASPNGPIERDPIAAVGRGKMTNGVKANKAWSEEEVRTFFKFTAKDRRLNPIWQLAIGSGMRREELCGLKWEDVDFDRGTVRVERTRTVVAGKPHDSDLPKTKKSRRTLSLGPVMAHLRSLQTLQKEDKLKAKGDAYVDEGWIFANELGVPYYPGMMSTWFRRAVKECGDSTDDAFRAISFHGCRHTCATLMLKAGQPVHVVSRFLGHASVQITLDYYAHVMEGQDETAVVALVALYS